MARKSWDDLEDEGLVGKFVNSDEFKAGIEKTINEATWDKGLPKVYIDKDGWIIRHWKDGRIEKIKDTNAH